MQQKDELPRFNKCLLMHLLNRGNSVLGQAIDCNDSTKLSEGNRAVKAERMHSRFTASRTTYWTETLSNAVGIIFKDIKGFLLT